ncbi:MAG: hypothetical protein R3F59_26900 [Myxococcota bacterium]
MTTGARTLAPLAAAAGHRLHRRPSKDTDATDGTATDATATDEDTQPTDADADADADSDADADADADSDADADADADTDTDTTVFTLRATPTNGAGVALTADGTVAVVANRTSGEITVMDLDLPNATGAIRVQFAEGDGEPWGAVISADETRAFAILRKSQQVVRIDDPRGAASPSGRARRDRRRALRPRDLPNGTKLYVANWGAGTVTVVDTTTMATHAVDLNGSLLATGALGSAVAAARPGLARPYALVVTDDGDGDDTDETVFVTEFFGQADPNAAFVDDSFFDTSRQGFVYRFTTGAETVLPAISLGASADMGFTDSNGDTAGCFPNALYALALDGDDLYVAGMCASPRGPAGPGVVDKVSNVKTKVEPVLYVVDTVSGAEDAARRLHLNAAWEDEYEATGVPDDASRRYPLIPTSLAFVPGTHILYLSAYGADAMFRVEFDGAGQVAEVGSVLNDFVNLAGGSSIGRLPYGIALDGAGHAVLVNENTRNLSLVDLGTQAVESVVGCASPVDAADPEAVAVNNGRRFFVTGLARWSLAGQAWNSCEGCHPNGLTDNVTWFFAAGPRQTVPLDGTYAPDGTHRMLNWTAIFDEVPDFELNTRGISGGVGAVVHDNTGAVVADDRIVFDGSGITGNQVATVALQAGLNGAVGDILDGGVPGQLVTGAAVTATSVLEDWRDIDDYALTIRAPRSPVLNPAAVAAGRVVFESNGCGGCHGGADWTIAERFYTPDQVTNAAVGGTLSTDTYSRGTLPIGLNPTADLGGGTAVLRSAGSIQCVLRAVGTFPASGTTGIAPAGVVVSERRDDMVTLAAGATGFGPPSLFGAGTGAPYLHAGNARTLEELLSSTFSSHHRAFSANFTPSGADLTNLIAFLQSIDDDTVEVSTAFGALDTVICP